MTRARLYLGFIWNAMPIISVDPARIVIPAKAKTARHKGLSTGSPWGCMLATAASINVSGMRPRLASRGATKIEIRDSLDRRG
jgi:hypothetical protein